MNLSLLDFNAFVSSSPMFEAVDKNTNRLDFVLPYSNRSEKNAQDRFVTEVSMMDYKELQTVLEQTKAKGAGILAGFAETWKKRIESGVDSGPLTKKGKWYVGEGAWRINSAKAAKIGMTPAGVKYYDPMQEEILQKHFAEDYGPSDTTVSADGKIDGLEVPKPEVAKERELELVTNENLKYIKLFEEEDDFTLGPPSSAKRAVVVDSPRLIRRLIQNFYLQTRDNVMIWGAPGIGKTEIVRQAAAEISKKEGKDIPVTVITLATKAKYDIQGVPLLFADYEKGQDNGLDPEDMKKMVLPKEFKGKVGMDFAYPAWLPAPSDKSDGILFFDEINRADAEVLGACLTLMLDRVSGSYRIPDGWRIWAAGNRDMDGPVTKMEGAMASRFLGGHFHLVPTVESWAEWTRTDGAFFKGIDAKKGMNSGEWYIPSEFISFLKLRDVRGPEGAKGGGGGSTITNMGKQYRVKFDFFYNWDSAASDENSGGKMEGFPTPRTWSKAFGNIYQQIKSNPKYLALASENVDPRSKTLSAFGPAIKNFSEFEEDCLDTLAAIVGTDAADAFMQFAHQMARYNDGGSSLIEKIENVFTDPKGPLPLIGLNEISADEAFGIMTLVEGRFDDLLASGKLGVQETLNWMKYLTDLGAEKKIRLNELGTHISALANKHPGTFKKILNKEVTKDLPEFKDKDNVKIFNDFIQVFKSSLQKMNQL